MGDAFGTVAGRQSPSHAALSRPCRATINYRGVLRGMVRGSFCVGGGAMKWQKGDRCEAGYLRVHPHGLCGHSGNNCQERCAFHYKGPHGAQVPALRADSERADCDGVRRTSVPDAGRPQIAALAAGSRRAKTAKPVECEASQSGGDSRNAQPQSVPNDHQ